MCFLVDKALEEEARTQLAADRRIRMDEAEQFRKHIELIDKQRKADNAMQRRTKMLKDATQVLTSSRNLKEKTLDPRA